MTRRFWAFTLAETLIVMGIIGVVAALTVPNLNASTGEKEKVAKVKKIYKDLNDAYGRATAVYGPIKKWGLTDDLESSDKFMQRLTDFLKYSKYCKGTAGCFTFGSIYYGVSEVVSIILPDSSSLFASFSSSCQSHDYPSEKYFGSIYIDIDGPTKGKNLRGIDIFEFLVTENGIFPAGDSSKPAFYHGGDSFYSATAWVIQNGNMDYLKTDSRWKCPDGKTVLNWTTNTTCK